MRPLFLYLAGTALFIIVVGLLTNQTQVKKINPFPFKTTLSYEEKVVKIKDQEIRVRVADTQEKRRIGLSETKKLNENEGMLFVFDDGNVRPKFWMKGMSLSIDIIWIKGNKIVQIDQEVPPPPANTPDNKLQLFMPNQDVDYVLEVSGGWSQRNNIKIGDPVTL